MKSMRIVSLLSLLLLVVFTVSSLSAAEIIFNRSGDIKITKPDGETITVGKGESLPDIPSGSTIAVLSMGIDIAPDEGFFKLVIGPSSTSIMKDQKMSLSIDPEAKKGSFGAVVGEFDIITEHTTVVLKQGSVCQIGIDKETGMVEIKSIFGALETITFCVKGTIPSAGMARFSVDAASKTVNVSSTTGVISLKAMEQEAESLGEGDSQDFECPEIGEIPVGEITGEEPPEPERPEASPHRPRDF